MNSQTGKGPCDSQGAQDGNPNNGKPRIAEDSLAESPEGGGRAGGQWQSITQGEAAEIGGLGNEDDDPDGWMSECAGYWESLPPAPLPTREAWLRSVIANATRHLAALMAKKAAPWPKRESDSIWANLANDALGLPRTVRSEAVNPNQIKQEHDDGEEPECELAPA